MAASMSALLGFFFVASSAAAAMTWPDWQYPHCGTSSAIQAAWTALPTLLAPMPSMVVIFLPAAALAGRRQQRVVAPPRCTVQAPHSAMPQPYLVPVRFRWSRNTHNSGVSGSASACMVLPLITREIIAAFLSEGNADNLGRTAGL